jgi:hypothetical protein
MDTGIRSKLKPTKQRSVMWHKPLCWLDIITTLDDPSDQKT